MEEAERQQEEKEKKTHNIHDIRCDKINEEKSATYGHKRTHNENYFIFYYTYID